MSEIAKEFCGCVCVCVCVYMCSGACLRWTLASLWPGHGREQRAQWRQDDPYSDPLPQAHFSALYACARASACPPGRRGQSKDNEHWTVNVCVCVCVCVCEIGR